MEYINDRYNWLFHENDDKRVKNWFMMSSPLPLLMVTTIYILLIKLILPAFMKSRPAYSLKTIIKWYNIFQIIANSLLVWGILTSGWTTTYHLGCMVPDYTQDPMSVRMLTYMWWTFMIKIVELIETAFFILRKRDRQASFLHIYHHMVTVWIMWAGAKYVGGGMASFAPMLNSSVHVIMYSYYLAASEGGPELRAAVNRWKKWLTVIQMVQFTILLFHGCQVFLPSCPAPIGITYIYIPNVVIIYYLFYDFFKKNYNKKALQNDTCKQS